jgi:hypothetical protein
LYNGLKFVGAVMNAADGRTAVFSCLDSFAVYNEMNVLSVQFTDENVADGHMRLFEFCSLDSFAPSSDTVFAEYNEKNISRMRETLKTGSFEEPIAIPLSTLRRNAASEGARTPP